MNPIIEKIQRVLETLQQCEARLSPGMSITELISLFSEHGIHTHDTTFTYGEHCESIDTTELPIDERVWINIEVEYGSNTIELLVECDDRDISIHALYCKNEFNLELFIPEKITCLKDMSKYDWFSCGNNTYMLGEKSQALLREIDSENGVYNKDRSYGKEIPQSWRMSTDHQGHVIKLTVHDSMYILVNGYTCKYCLSLKVDYFLENHNVYQC